MREETEMKEHEVQAEQAQPRQGQRMLEDRNGGLEARHRHHQHRGRHGDHKRSRRDDGYGHRYCRGLGQRRLIPFGPGSTSGRAGTGAAARISTLKLVCLYGYFSVL